MSCGSVVWGSEPCGKRSTFCAAGDPPGPGDDAAAEPGVRATPTGVEGAAAAAGLAVTVGPTGPPMSQAVRSNPASSSREMGEIDLRRDTVHLAVSNGRPIPPDGTPEQLE